MAGFNLKTIKSSVNAFLLNIWSRSLHGFQVATAADKTSSSFMLYYQNAFRASLENPEANSPILHMVSNK